MSTSDDASNWGEYLAQATNDGANGMSAIWQGGQILCYGQAACAAAAEYLRKYKGDADGAAWVAANYCFVSPKSCVSYDQDRGIASDLLQIAAGLAMGRYSAAADEQPPTNYASALSALPANVRADVAAAIQRAESGTISFTGHDGKEYANTNGLLPTDVQYTEWTVASPDAKRGPYCVILGGDAKDPSAVYFWDHVNPPVRIG